jgi:hypothetical protein
MHAKPPRRRLGRPRARRRLQRLRWLCGALALAGALALTAVVIRLQEDACPAARGSVEQARARQYVPPARPMTAATTQVAAVRPATPPGHPARRC